MGVCQSTGPIHAAAPQPRLGGSGRASAPKQQPQNSVSQPAPAAIAPKTTLDEDETKAKRLFSACLARDKWVDALIGTEPWHAERTSALTRSKTSGGTERVHVHRSSGEGDGAVSCFVATILSSPHSPPGEVLWQVDAREKTTSAFGEPGYGGLILGSSSCVMLVDQSDEATVLYFYVGERVALRCWRRSATPEHGKRSSGSDGGKNNTGGKSSSSQAGGQRSEEELKRRERRREKQQKQQHEQSGRSRRDGKRGSSGGSSGGDKASSEKKKRRRSHDDASRHGRRSGGGGSGGSGSDSAAAGELPGVAAWARGKDLAACLCDLSGAFGHALPDAGLPRPPSVEALRKSRGALRQAYHKALLAVHPDKHVSSTPERQALCEALFVVLSAAHAAAAAKEGEQQQAC